MRLATFAPTVMTTILSAVTMMHPSSAFSTSPTFVVNNIEMSTTAAPTREKIKTGQKTGRKTDWTTGQDLDDEDSGAYFTPVQEGDQLEWLKDDEDISRGDEDPFHILLLGTTFNQRDVTIWYVGASLNNVLAMPMGDAEDAAEFADEHGFSCLGTWPRKECIELGKQLQQRQIHCRVVPFCEGGGRGWQAKRAGGNYASSGSGNENRGPEKVSPGEFQ